jgi:hypothetical protein
MKNAAGLLADAKLDGVAFERMPVSSPRQREEFWHAVSACDARANKHAERTGCP